MVRALVVLSVFLLASCAGPTRSVTVRVTTVGGEALARAHVFAVAAGRSPAALPVTPETLEEALTRERASGWTDASGEARLVLDDDAGHYLFVRAPPVGAHALGPGEAGAWRFVLAPGGAIEEESRGGEASTLRVEIVR